MTKFKEVLETLNNVSERGVERTKFDCALLEHTECPSTLFSYVAIIYATVDEASRNSYVAALFSEEYAHELKSDLDDLLGTLIFTSNPRQEPTPKKKEYIIHRWEVCAIKFNNKWGWLGKMKVDIGDFIGEWDYAIPAVPGNITEAIGLLQYCVWNLHLDSTQRMCHWGPPNRPPFNNTQASRFAYNIFAMRGMGDAVAEGDDSLAQANQVWKDAVASDAKALTPQDAMSSPILKAMLEVFPYSSVDTIATMLAKVKDGATPLEAIESTQWSEENFVEKLNEIMETSPWKS